uniref:Uncharacterized protein n=1 Tax=Romanomermis culicivorax TaxID=13658 RepID=A0A915KVW9_ROMCU
MAKGWALKKNHPCYPLYQIKDAFSCGSLKMALLEDRSLIPTLLPKKCDVDIIRRKLYAKLVFVSTLLSLEQNNSVEKNLHRRNMATNHHHHHHRSNIRGILTNIFPTKSIAVPMATIRLAIGLENLRGRPMASHMADDLCGDTIALPPITCMVIAIFLAYMCLWICRKPKKPGDIRRNFLGDTVPRCVSSFFVIRALNGFDNIFN